MNKLKKFAESLPRDLAYLVFTMSDDEGFGGCNLSEEDAKIMENIISNTMAENPVVKLVVMAGVFNYIWNHPENIPVVEKGFAELREAFEQESINLFNNILDNERNDAE